MLCGGAQSPGVPSRGRMGTGEEENLCQTATQKRRTSLMTAPHRWETTSRTVRQETDEAGDGSNGNLETSPCSVSVTHLSSQPFFSPGFSFSILALTHPSFCPRPPLPVLFLLCFSGLKQLLDAQQLCDVTLLVEGKKFMCHRYNCHILQFP